MLSPLFLRLTFILDTCGANENEGPKDKAERFIFGYGVLIGN